MYWLWKSPIWNPPPPPAAGMPRSSRDLPGRVSPWWVVGGTIVGASLVFGGLVAYSTYASAAAPAGGGPGVIPGGEAGGVPVLPPGEGPDIPGETPSGGSRDPDRGKKGTGKIKPGPNNVGPVASVDGWGGGQYGPGPIPEEFDWNGNLVYFSPDCRTVAEPLMFLPIPGSQEILNWWMPANGGPSAQAPLAIALGWVSAEGLTGTAWGYIARLVARRKRDGEPINVEQIAVEVLAELLEFQADPPLCPDPLDVEAFKDAPPSFQRWWRSFLERVEFGVSRFRNAWFVWNESWDVE